MKKNGLVTALCGSALLNAFLLGMLVPRLFMPHPPGPHGGPNPIVHMRDALDVLDEPYRDQVAAMLDKHDISIRNRMDALHKSFMALPVILTSPAMNVDDFKAADKEMSANDVALHNEINGMIADIAGQLPAEQRARFFHKALPPQQAHGGRDMPPPE